jgi:hypothetical protein
MDETAFRQAREAAVRHPCPFEKALLAGCGACSLSARLNIAEREAVACLDAAARDDCATLLGLMRRNSAFALHLSQADTPLTHAQEMKVQCGGLAGLQRALTGKEAIGDIHALVQAARRAHADLAALPYAEIVQSVTAWRTRRRAGQS